jgi:ABC-2 type transport system ATP-binding protein
VDRAELRGGSLVLETRVSGQVLSALDARGGLDGVQTRAASLEDVYLRLTAEADDRTPHDTQNTEHRP